MSNYEKWEYWKQQADIRAAKIERLTAENKRFELALRWALGESPPDRPEFPVVDGPPYYRWRTDLRRMAGLRADGTKYNPDSGQQK